VPTAQWPDRHPHKPVGDGARADVRWIGCGRSLNVPPNSVLHAHAWLPVDQLGVALTVNRWSLRSGVSPLVVPPRRPPFQIHKRISVFQCLNHSSLQHILHTSLPYYHSSKQLFSPCYFNLSLVASPEQPRPMLYLALLLVRGCVAPPPSIR